MLGSSFYRVAVAAASVAVVASSLVGVAHASPSVSAGSNATVGHTILTDDRGLTLYRFTNDEAGASSCYDWCAQAWPPVLVDGLPVVVDPALAVGLGTIARKDGGLQLTYGGSPLYYYVGDRHAGDANGQGVEGAWFVVDVPAQ